MTNKRSRREFVAGASLSVMGAAVGLGQDGVGGQAVPEQAVAGQAGTPGAPPAFGTAPAVGPEVTQQTFSEAEKLLQAPLTAKDRAQAAGNWRQSMAAVYERRVGPRKVAIPDGTVPYSSGKGEVNSPEISASELRFKFKRPGPALAATEAEIAFGPVTMLAQWIFNRKLTSERLTGIYLDRIQAV